MEVEMYYVGAATCIVEIDKKFKIGIDPALSIKGTILNFKNFDSIRKISPKYTEDVFEEIEVWLITHAHDDHIDAAGLGVISSESILVCEKKAKQNYFKDCVNARTLMWGEKYSIELKSYTISITAVPAYHGNNFITRKLVGKVNGYIVECVCKENNDSVTIYFTGDTTYHTDVISAISPEVDVMIANVGGVRSDMKGGPLTMDLEMLTRFVRDINPVKTFVVHVDDFSHYETTKKEVEEAGFLIPETGCWIDINDESD